MAPSRLLLLLVSLLLLLLLDPHLVESRPASESEMLANEGTVRSPLDNIGIDCGGACAERCKVSSRPNLCKRACGTCCARCNCVPPGTYGNYETCPCYGQMTTRGGRRKCP